MLATTNPANISRVAPPPSAGTWSSPGYRSARTRATWAQVVVGLAVVAVVLSAVVVFGGVEMLDRLAAGTATESEVLNFVKLTEGLGNLTTLLQVVGAICVLAWLHRAVSNVPALGRGTPRWSPTQSVAWWFVPIAFLVMPFVVVRDVLRRMSPDGGQAITGLVVAWWLLYLVGSLGGRVVGQAMDTAVTIDEVRTLFMVTMGLLVAVAGSGALLIWLIRATEANAAELAPAGCAQLPAAPAGPAWGVPPPSLSGSSWSNAQPVPVDAVTPVASAEFCPRCATKRVPATRYCPSCAFDFTTMGSPR